MGFILQEIKTQATTININTRRNTETIAQNNNTEIQPKNFLYNIIFYIKQQFLKVIYLPKVNSVLKNIGICAVNGGMELISHFLPSPMIPLIASLAGTLIPFEPVVMLRHQNPVTTYRRAFGSAFRTFLNTFNQYREVDDDPYMEKKFYRRFMNSEDDKIKN